MSLYTHLTSLHRSQAGHGSANPFENKLSVSSKVIETFLFRLNLFVVKIRFRINHLLQEVEQVEVDAHAEVDGVSRLDEVEGPYVRIKSF